jgi:PilZ domain
MDHEHRDVTEPIGATPQQQRKSDRIRYAFSIEITGSDSSNERFSQSAKTQIVTRDGGVLLCPLSLNVGAVITVMRAGNRNNARIVGQVGLLNEEQLYGFQFLDPASDFWGIKFAEPNVDAAGRAVLECSACSQQKIVPLGEVEVLVFESTRVIAHECDRCLRQTLWTEPSVLGEPEFIIGDESYRQSFQPPRRAPGVNDRKHQRVSMRNTKACIKRRGFTDDVVDVIDLSRGGVHFVSMVDYYKGTIVEVAVPYTDGGLNVFVPAEIARIQCRPTSGLPGDYGLRYVKR